MIKPEQMRDAWDQFAAGYDEAVTPFSMQIAEDALQRVGIRLITSSKTWRKWRTCTDRIERCG